MGLGVMRVCPVSPTLPLGREDQDCGGNHPPRHVEKKKEVIPERHHSPEVNEEERF